MGLPVSKSQSPVSTVRAQQLPCLKIAIVGDSGVGKSSILTRYVHNQFSSIYTPTKKVAIENIVKKVNLPGHALVSVTFWDIPGREEFDLYKSYFTNLDAAIVVVNMTDNHSVEMGLVWKQLLMNNMLTRTVSDQTPGVKKASDMYSTVSTTDKLSLPILLLGSKLDQVDTTINGEDVNNEEKLNRKLACINFFKEFGNQYNFTGSVAVSAKDNDGSVHQSLQSFIRHLLEKHQPTTTTDNKYDSTISPKNRSVSVKMFETCGIEQVDGEFKKAQKYVNKVELLIKASTSSKQRFLKKCIKAGLTEKDDASLETCVVALKKYFCSPDTSLVLDESDQFCTLKVESSMDNFKMAACYKKIFHIFNEEHSASVKQILKEFPHLKTTLNNIDEQINELCLDYEGQHLPEPESLNVHIDYQMASCIIEKNRARLRVYQNQIKECLNLVTQSLTKIRNAFVW